MDSRKAFLENWFQNEVRVILEPFFKVGAYPIHFNALDIAGQHGFAFHKAGVRDGNPRLHAIAVQRVEVHRNSSEHSPYFGQRFAHPP